MNISAILSVYFGKNSSIYDSLLWMYWPIKIVEFQFLDNKNFLRGVSKQKRMTKSHFQWNTVNKNMSTVILCVFCKFQLSFLNLRKNYWSCDGNAEFLLGCYQQLCSWIWQIVMSNERWQKILAVVMSQVAVSVSLPVPVEQKFFLCLARAFCKNVSHLPAFDKFSNAKISQRQQLSWP